MKTKTLLKRLSELLANPSKDMLDEVKALRQVLKNLKEKQQQFKYKLRLANNPLEEEELKVKLDVIYAQRRKGIERLVQLKKELKK